MRCHEHAVDEANIYKTVTWNNHINSVDWERMVRYFCHSFLRHKQNA